MEQDFYAEELLDLVRNALAPIEKYFGTFIDIGAEDQEPRKIFIDDIGQTGLALCSHAQEEILTALEALHQRVGRISVRRAAMDNNLGMRPRKILDVEVGEAEPDQGWAKH